MEPRPLPKGSPEYTQWLLDSGEWVIQLREDWERRKRWKLSRQHDGSPDNPTDD